ncbi:MAG: hypothetical protein B7C24_18300 [Bacteroidetes bacterium 4572_77]|nr:MAG: hypothetical protein B7C24_18300 [Bacteroidetes bacterium 4572_77]
MIMKKITKKYLSEIDGFKGFEETISNFAIAFLFLSKKPRIAISNFYILCSYLDDIVDTTEPYTIEEKHNLLAQWKENINSIYQNKSILRCRFEKQSKRRLIRSISILLWCCFYRWDSVPKFLWR